MACGSTLNRVLFEQRCRVRPGGVHVRPQKSVTDFVKVPTETQHGLATEIMSSIAPYLLSTLFLVKDEVATVSLLSHFPRPLPDVADILVCHWRHSHVDVPASQRALHRSSPEPSAMMSFVYVRPS